MGAFAAFSLPFAAYVWTACPTFHWLDASEFAAAAASLGIAHPPGHPLAVLWMRAFQLLPVGSLAFRANLASAAACALAALVLYGLALTLLDRLASAIARERENARPWPMGLSTWLALATAWGWAFSGSAWLQGVRAEVYALQGLIVFGALHQLLRWEDGDRQAVKRAALLLGLGLGNHHLLTLLCVLAAVPWVLASGRRREFWAALPYALLGLLILVYLPIRATRDPEVNWGAPTSLERLFWLISARPFQRTVLWVAEQQPLLARIRELGLSLADQLNVGATISALGGLYLLLRLSHCRRHGLLLAALTAANLAGALAVGFDPANPDSHGYVLLSLGVGALCCACFVGGALAIVVEQRPRMRWAAVAGPALLVLSGWRAVQTWPEADLSHSVGAEEFARAMIDAVPPGGTLMTQDFRSVFNFWYLRAAEGARPDIVHVHAGFMGFLGYPTPARYHAMADGGAITEYHSDLTAERLAQLGPAGLVLAPGGSLALHQSRSFALRQRLRKLPHDLQTDHAELWWHYQMAQYFCRTEKWEPARAEMVLAQQFSTSPMLKQLAQHCRP